MMQATHSDEHFIRRVFPPVFALPSMIVYEVPEGFNHFGLM
jgi:hypothetical protein